MALVDGKEESMFLWIIKGITDVCWYLAVMHPVIWSMSDTLQRVFLAVPIIYLIGMAVLKKKGRLVVRSQTQVFFWECRILAAAFLIHLIYYTDGRLESVTCMWAALFLMFGIFQLRLERLDEEEQKSPLFLAWNAVTFGLIFLGAVLLGSSPVMQSVLWVVKSTYFYMIVPILMGIVYLIGMAADGILSVLDMIFPDSSMIQEVLGNLRVQGQPEILSYPENIEKFPVSLHMIFLFLAGVAVCIVLWIFGKKLMSALEERENEGLETIVKRKISDRDREQKNGSTAEENGQNRVRRVYRKFLVFCRKKGIQFKVSDTSEEIKKRAVLLGGEERVKELEELRALYIEARYKDNISSKEQEEKAERCYKSWKSSVRGVTEQEERKKIKKR